MAGRRPREPAADNNEEEPPIISPREGLEERLRKARERRRRRSSGNVIPGGEAAATAMPETATGRPELGHASAIGTAEGVETAVQSNVEDVKASLAKKRGLLQQQRKHRKQEANRMLARRQSTQMEPASKFEHSASQTGDAEQQPRLFDEHNDDEDDDDGYGNFGGKNDGLRVVLVAPDRSPAAPPQPTGWCGQAATAEKGAPAADQNIEGGASSRPVPVLVGGLRGADTKMFWSARSDSEKVKRERAARAAAADDVQMNAAAGGGEQAAGGGRKRSGTEEVRRDWVAARDTDESNRRLKEEEGLAVVKLPKAASALMRRGMFQDRLLRDAVFARAEEEERKAWEGLLEDEHGGNGNGHGDEGAASDIGDIYSERDGHSQHHAPSATVVPHGRGPSQATDFFSARGAPSILEDPLEQSPMRVERPPADEEPPPPSYLEASVRRPVEGIGPEARLAGLDERTELRIIVPRVAFHDHPLFLNEDRLSASLRTLFGRYRAKMESDEEVYLRRRLFASLSALLELRAQGEGAHAQSSPTAGSVKASKLKRVTHAASVLMAPKKTRETAGWLLRDALSTLASILVEKEEVLRLEQAMNALWIDLEEERSERGVSSTPTRLEAREVEKEDEQGGDAISLGDGYGAIDEMQEERAATTFFSPEGGNGEGGEGRAPSFEDQLDRLEDLSKWVRMLESAHALRNSQRPTGARAMAGGKAAKTVAKDRQRREAEEKLQSAIGQCRASLASLAGPGAKKGERKKSYVLRLSNEGVVTSDAGCGRLERMRRDKARALRFRASVFVNGSKVSTTPAVRLEWPEFACSFNHLIKLRLVRRPQSVMVTISSCSGIPWWPDQEVASVWVPVPGGQDTRSGHASASGPPTTHAFAPRTQWSQFSSRRPMATSGPLAERRTCGSVLVGTEWATSRDGAEDNTGGGVIVEGGDASAPALPVRRADDSLGRFNLLELLKSVWTVDGRTKLRAKPLQGLRPFASTSLGSMAGEDRSGAGGASGGCGDQGVARRIPDFARELDFLRLLPQGSDVDPNDPRLGNVLRLHGLLAALGLGRRESSSSGQGATGGMGRRSDTRQKGSGHGGGETDGEEDHGAFRASQEQQVLVFAGKREAAAGGALARKGNAGGGGGFRTFAYNNHHRWKEPLRHTLIRLRAQKPALFGHRPIPFREEDIRRDDTFMAILAQEASARVHRQQVSGRRGSAGDPELDVDADKQKKRMAVDHSRVMDFVQRVRDSRTAQARRQATKRVTYASVVQEESVPKLGLTFGSSEFFPKPKRALRPEPKERAAATVQLDQCRLLLQIISARNVPVRSLEETAGGVVPTPVAASGLQHQQQKQSLAKGGGSAGDDDPGIPLPGDEDYEEERVTRQKGTLSSFIEVQFQDTRKRTSAYEGLTPLWKESLDLPFTPPMADFSPANLAQVNEMIIISLFDEVEFDDRGSGGYLDDETSIRREKHFLGSVVLPFQTVYRAGRVEEVLRLEVPSVNLGYDQMHAGVAGIDAGEVAEDAGEEEGSSGNDKNAGFSLTGGAGDPASPAALVQKADRSTYIRVLATLDPIPIVLAKERVQGSNQESPGLVEAGARWVKRVNAVTRLPQGVQPVQLFVPDMFGNDVLVTRYLCPQEPPPGLNTVPKCAHFVRLLPFLEDWQMFEGVDDMWCTSQQLLDILAGDDEEHAILLHNFILHLIMVNEGNSGANRRTPERTGQRTEVYIVLGRGVPEGNTVYVMVQEFTRFEELRSTAIWKPATGEGFDARDTRCPLVDIACVVTQENVWACLHRNVRPCDLNLNPADVKTWAPFFSSPGNPAPAQGYTSIQEDIAYRPTQQSFVYEVEDVVREALKRDIRRWRSKRSHTAFNADVSNRLAELLPLLEKQALQGDTKMRKDEHRRRLENTMRSRHIVGFPLHAGFVDVDHVVQMVRATGIHEARHPEVQFALAVQAFAYPHNVLSVWVYIASITPK